MMIKGETVKLYERSSTDVDQFNHEIITETEVEIPNVLIAPVSSDEITDTINLYGKKAVYQLAIPKGDTHEWENCRVSFFGENWRVIGKPTVGIDSMIPGLWNKKVKVESYVSETD